MNEYKREMFQFLTQRENFETMAEIVDQYESVAETLVAEFWMIVKDTCIRKLNESSLDDWTVSLDKDVFSTYSKLSLYKTTWKVYSNEPIIGIVIEKLARNPYYGLWLNRNNKAPWDLSKIKSEFRKNKPENFNADNHEWWAFYLETHYNFMKSSSLKNIIPERRDETADNIASDVMVLVKELNAQYIPAINSILQTDSISLLR